MLQIAFYKKGRSVRSLIFLVKLDQIGKINRYLSINLKDDFVTIFTVFVIFSKLTEQSLKIFMRINERFYQSMREGTLK